MKLLRLDYDVERGVFVPFGGVLRAAGFITVFTGDQNILQVQAKYRNQPYDLSGWGDDALLGFKTQDAWRIGGDYEAAQRGFLTGGFHNLAQGQVQTAFALGHPLANQTLYAGWSLYNDVPNQFTFGSEPLRFEVLPGINTGSESNIPGGAITPLQGEAEIAGAATSVVVPLGGMTPEGFVSVWFAGGNAGQTIPWVSQYANNAFTISVNAAPQIDPGDGLKFVVGWRVLRKSL